MNKLSQKNIAIIRLSSLGDIIHTLPAFDFLKKTYPNIKMSWIVESTGAALLKNFTDIDEIIILKLKNQNLTTSIKNLRKFLIKYRKKFDLIIDFQGLLKSAIISFLLKSCSIGFHRNNLKESLAAYFYNKTMEYFNENNHVIYKNLSLAYFAIEVLKFDIFMANSSEFRVDLSKIKGKIAKLVRKNGQVKYPKRKVVLNHKIRKFLSDNNLKSKRFIILNLGAGWPTKKLEIDQYIKIVENLKDKYKIVLLWGNLDEKNVAEHISMKTNTLLTEFLKFNELISFIEDSLILISSDTLALHIADMVNTISIGIFGPTSPSRNGSLQVNSISIFNKSDCSFCYKRKCDKMICLKTIEIEAIIKAVDSIYEKYC